MKLVAFTAIGFVLGEVALRLVFPSFDLNLSWHYHRTLGWTQVPNGRFHYETGHEDGDVETVWIGFNSHGFRDVERDPAKPDGVRRIVLIGDSFSESLQVNLGDAFFRLLEQRLTEREAAAGRSRRWEIVNLGVGDWGTAQQLLCLREVGRRYEPDLVLHQVFPANDISNNTLALHGACRSDNDHYRPYFVLDGDTLRQTAARPWIAAVRRNLVSFAICEWLVDRAVAATTVRAETPRPERDLATLAARGLPPLDPILHTWVPVEQHGLTVLADGWRVTERLLEATAAEARAQGAGYFAFVVPSHARVGREWPKFRDRHADIPLDPTYADRRLAATFERLDVPHVLLKPVFDEHEDEVLPYRGGHLNPRGHRVTADVLFDALVASGLLDR